MQWVWIVAVFGFCIALALRHWEQIDLAAIHVSPAGLATSFILLTFGKVLAGLVSVRIFAQISGGDRMFAFLAYHLSQMGKYIPGSVWQHVSRAYMYRNRGVPAGPLATTIVLELGWVLASSLVIGFGLLLLVRPDAIMSSLAPLVAELSAPLIVAAIVATIIFLLALLVLVLVRYRHMLSTLLRAVRLDPLLLVLLVGMWWLFGVSLQTLLPVDGSQAPMAYIIGLFAIAYGLGFLVVFAPAGLGVREAVLVSGLSPLVGLGPSIIIVAVHRLLYLVNDAVFFVAAHAYQRVRNSREKNA